MHMIIYRKFRLLLIPMIFLLLLVDDIMQTRVIGLTIVIAMILATLSSISTISYAQKAATNLSKDSIRGALTSVQNDASTVTSI